SLEQRLPELLYQAKSDPDERKRSAAVTELGNVNGKSHPEVVAVLADIARTDPKPAVRHDALSSLAQIRPISPTAGQTLEWAAAHEQTWRTRLHAKSLLLRYQLAGYQAGKGDAKNESKHTFPPMTPEPPLGEPSHAKDARSTILFPNLGKPMPSKTPPVATPAQPANSLPVIVDQPPVAPPVPGPTPPPVVVNPSSSAPSMYTTPPPVIVSQPSAAKGVPPAPAPTVVIPPLPSTHAVPPAGGSTPASKPSAPAPKLTLEPAPASASATPPAISEPNFRPAGQAPPRSIGSPAVPERPRSVPPSPSKSDSGPVLTSPM
ncbi:MAG: HEAT repeat domain-containing protein, partial [Gemmataceae bacterium]|nr:HEAT repeat domain-containing protein [Gemmataceae bacterium]